ncbi:hypothetical protein CRYUN_Cryun34aG0102100 [Craigia yunnanensis]
MRKMLPNFLKPEALQRYIGMMDIIVQIHFEDPDHVSKFYDPFNAMASGIISVPINLPGTPFRRAIKASELIRKELMAIIKVLGLLIWGHDTASAAITFILKYLAELPTIYNEVYKEQMEIARSKKPRELLNWEDIQKMKYPWNVACDETCSFTSGCFQRGHQ